MADGLESHPRRAVRRAVVAVGAITALALPGFAAGAAWDFTPRVTVGQTWTDNVTLEDSGLEESEWISELRPGFSLANVGPRVNLLFDYDLQALWYADNSDYDDLYHQARGDANFILVPQSLFVDAFTRYEQQNIDPAGRIGHSNMFETGNRTDSWVYGISPYHVGRWGAWGESLLRYHYQAVDYINTDPGATFVQDSDTQAVSASLGSPQDRRGFSWRTFGDYSDTEYDSGEQFEFARVGLDLGVPVGLRTRATATVGRESDVAEDFRGGGLDSTYWFVGFEWQPSDLQNLSARVGERYYGTALEAHWNRRGSQGEVGLDYTEEPTTSGGVLGDDGVFVPGYRPGGVPRLDARVYLRKRLSGSASYNFVRSELGARIYSERRSYEDETGGTERESGVIVNYDWRLAPRTTLGASADFQRRTWSNDNSDEMMEFSVNVNREITRTLSGQLRAGHLRRDGDTGNDYNVNRISIYLTAQF